MSQDTHTFVGSIRQAFVADDVDVDDARIWDAVFGAGEDSPAAWTSTRGAAPGATA